MDPLKEYLPEGYKFNEDRDYLLPIPPDEIQMDHELNQNPGWPTEVRRTGTRFIYDN